MLEDTVEAGVMGQHGDHVSGSLELLLPSTERALWNGLITDATAVFGKVFVVHIAFSVFERRGGHAVAYAFR